MRLQLRSLFMFRVVVAFAGVWVVVVNPSLAGPEDYTVTRTIAQEETTCEDGSATVTLQGSGPGDPAETMTVTEIIVPEDPGNNEFTVSAISNGGIATSGSPSVLGIFDARTVVAHQTAQGTNNITTYDANRDIYTSTSTTARDIWAGGDTFEYAYTQLEGDFDTSIRLDSYAHDGGDGCWGKYGLMARQTVDGDSRHIFIQNHGPKGVLPGGTGPFPCTERDTSTSLAGRRLHRPGPPIGPIRGMFESIWDEANETTVYRPNDSYPRLPENGVHFSFNYLRLTRRGDLFQGWGSSDPEVETDPTDDSLWTELTIPELDPPDPEGNDGPFLAEGSPTCWYVGFGHSEHAHAGSNVETVEFTVLNWSGASCFEVEDPSLIVTWEDVPRSEVTSGLSYLLEADVDIGTMRMNFTGGAADDNSIDGPITVELSNSLERGDLTQRIVGPTGGGEVTNDGSLYTMTGTGANVWHGGDHMNYVFRRVTGDFDATAFLFDVDLSRGGGGAALGINARQTCHFDSENDFIRIGNTQVPTYTFRPEHRMLGITQQPYLADEPRPPEGEDPFRPDHLRLIRTGSQMTAYLAWDDPDNVGRPLEWFHVGSRNAPGRPADHVVGIALNSETPGAPDVFNMTSFTLNVEPYSPAPLDPAVPMDGVTLFERNFDTTDDGQTPNRAVTALSAFRPVVMGGRLRVTDELIQDAASAVWFEDVGLSDLLDTGFIAEFDVGGTMELLPPGEGAAFVVVGNGADLIEVSDCRSRNGVVEEWNDLGVLIGTDQGGFNETTVDDNDTPADPTDDVYTNNTSSGGEIGQSCDDFNYDYTEVTGDFSVAIEILSQSHDFASDPTHQWGKQGIMARESLDRNSRFFQVHETYPGDAHNAHVNWRPTVAGPDLCDDTRQIATPFLHPRFLRLTRRGNTFQGWLSNEPGLGDGTLDPHSDCNWFGVTSDTIDDMPETINLGFAHNEHESGDDVAIQTCEYRILPANPDGGVLADHDETDFVGVAGEMGFGGGQMITRADTRPMLAVEIDTRNTPTANNEGAMNGAPGFPGTYHVGINVGASQNSRQNSEEFGVAAEDMPDIFAGDVHMTIEYRPNGEIEVWLKDATVTKPDRGTQVISTFIPPMNLGVGEADPIIGFVGSTALGASQTLEFDNLTIRRLGEPAGTVFRRADCDQSGTVDFNDAIFHLKFLFLGEKEDTVNSCRDACDSDDSGTDDFTDDINTLKVLFLGQGTIPAPGPLPNETHPCGLDPTLEEPDELTCETYAPTIACP